MRRITVILSFCAVSLLVQQAGCGSNNSNGAGTNGTGTFGNSSANTAPVVVTLHNASAVGVTNAPPTGTSVLSFRVQITGLSLVGTGGTANASLLSSPVTVQLANEQTLDDVIASDNVKPGTFSGLMVTFGTASMTIQNTSGSTLTIGGTACTNGSTCTVTPTLSQVSATVTPTPSSSLTLVAGQPEHFAVALNVGNSITNTGGTVTITPTLSAAGSGATNGSLTSVSGVTGPITNTGTNQFTVTDSATGQPVAVATNSSTTFSSFNNGIGGCTTNPATAACLKNGQIVTTNFGVGTSTSGMTNTATNVTLATNSTGTNFTKAVEGTVVSKTASAMTIVVTGEPSAVTGISVGQTANATLSTTPAATFSVTTSTGSTIPNTDVFTGLSNVVVGQNVLLEVGSITSGAPPTIVADQVQLLPAQVCGTASALANPNFTLGTLPGTFTGAGETSIQTVTGANTQFFASSPTVLTGFSNIMSGSTFCVGGLLFQTSTASQPTILAGQVAATAH